MLLTTLARALVSERVASDRWCWVSDAGKPVLALMHSGSPAAYLSDGPAEPLPRAAELLAEELHRGARPLAGIGGPEASVAAFAGRWTSLIGRDAGRVGHQLLMQCAEPRPLSSPAGQLRLADVAELGLITQWVGSFAAEAQSTMNRPEAGTVTAALAERRLWLWDHDGQPVAMLLRMAPAIGVVRIGLVYVPPEFRGRGFASAALAETVTRISAAGHSVVLYVDVNNHVARELYAALGFQEISRTTELSFSSELSLLK
ncbi:MAG: GNAT family N-acetyltransferase [Angustibacter sp.]